MPRGEPIAPCQVARAAGAGILAHQHLFGLESRHQPLLSRRAFARRLGWSFGAASLLIAVSLLAGMAGYHLLEGMAWIDAFANASMILSGMGPLDPPRTWAGKLFAGLYALYSGLAVFLAAGILFTPVVHRLLHRFHLEAGGGGEERGR
jgi:hypothetical protein